MRWTAQEDKQLLAAVESCGTKDWRLVALFVDGRDGSQCAKRWAQTVDPALQHGKRFSVAEERALYLLVRIVAAPGPRLGPPHRSLAASHRLVSRSGHALVWCVM